MPAAVASIQSEHISTLRAIGDRVLWISSAMVDHANRVRGDRSGLKVGGHQASSASMVTLMTTLWFDQLRSEDRVSVKPHASPVLHAINYLLGLTPKEKLTTLREFGGLQSYPSRTKDAGQVDYSTGSVGIGATATIWGAIARRYVEGHGGTAPRGRQYALLGDAELDEGAIWEAINDPQVHNLGELVWIVDYNRQSLDRVVPAIGIERLSSTFAAAGWQVLVVKYGSKLTEIFRRPGGEDLRARIDRMSNDEYQRLLRCTPSELEDRLLNDASAGLRSLLASVDTEELWSAVRDLGGHDPETLLETFAEIVDDRPTIVFAYTIKGYGLPSEGHPQNHSALMSVEQVAVLRDKLGIDPDDIFASFAAGSREQALCERVSAELVRSTVARRAAFDPPEDLGWHPNGVSSTQAALGRIILDVSRKAPTIAARIVTVSPDVTSSTNLGGWVNKAKVWTTSERRNWFDDDADTILHWVESQSGQHIELGIAETNLVGLIAELGSTWSRWSFPLIPIATIYDPFVGRALEPWSFGMYAGGQSILVGTPSGVTLASEGGAHQSVITPSIGLEQPGLISYEPAFAVDLEWALLESIGRIGREGGSSTYLRLSTRPIDQTLAAVPATPEGRELRRRQVLAGGYRLRPVEDPDVVIAAMGALIPEALAAAESLATNGVSAEVLCITSPNRLFDAVQQRSNTTGTAADSAEWILRTLFPSDRRAPLVTVLDGHPHTLAFLGAINHAPAAFLGVTEFGQSGDLESVYRHHGIDALSISLAALGLVRG